jgi:hypothetical protein
MVWAESRDYYNYNPSRDKSFFRAVADLRPLNDIFPDEALINTSVKDVKKRFIYPEQSQSSND